jgi:hypothetical protein
MHHSPKNAFAGVFIGPQERPQGVANASFNSGDCDLS